MPLRMRYRLRTHLWARPPGADRPPPSAFSLWGELLWQGPQISSRAPESAAGPPNKHQGPRISDKPPKSAKRPPESVAGSPESAVRPPQISKKGLPCEHREDAADSSHPGIRGGKTLQPDKSTSGSVPQSAVLPEPPRWQEWGDHLLVPQRLPGWPCFLHSGPMGPAGRPAASTWMLFLPSVLALQPGAEEGGPAPEQTSQWEDHAPCGDPVVLDGALPLLHHPPHTWRTRPMGVGTGVRQSGAAPQGQPGGAESQIPATQSGASSQPSRGASSRRPPPGPYVPNSELSPGP